MTGEEMEQLKAMSVNERIKRFLPRLSKGEITQAQYKSLLDYAIERTQDNQEPKESHQANQPSAVPDDRLLSPLEAFGGYIVEDKPIDGEAQWKKIYELMKDGKWHDTEQIKQAVYDVHDTRGLCRISERIRDIEKYTGVKHESRHKDKAIWEYRLLLNNQLL